MRAALVLAPAFAAAVLTGCSANGGSAPPSGASSGGAPLAAHRAGWLAPGAKAHKHLLYVADQFGQTVYIFPQSGFNPPPVGAITDGIAGPDGLFVDGHGALYVCNFGAGTVTVYPRGTTSPSKTLTGAGAAPIDVVVGRDGTVYVADFADGQDGHVFEYRNGATAPTTTIALAGYPEGLALDHAGNLFVAYQKTPTAGTVLEFAPHSTQGRDLNLPITLVGGATIDAHDNLLVADQSNPFPHVDVFAPGASQPMQRIGGFALAFDIALNHAENRLFVTQPQNPAVVYVVSYPGGTILRQISNTLTAAYGVATSPDGSP
jgi:hypothetical protein